MREWVARRMCKYAGLMRAPRQPRPWLLTGREVGIGPDHEPLLAECHPLAWVGPSALADAAEVYQRRFTVGRDARALPARSPNLESGTSVVAPGDTRCPFCFPAAIAPEQLLVTTEHFHVLALAGQIIEGFIGIMTNVCRDGPIRLRCMDDVPMPWVDELEALSDLVSRFYHEVYGARALLYEHGRGGGGRSSVPGGDFVFHPHLCALPWNLDVHEPLRTRFSYRRAVRFPALRTAIGRRPYLYVHTPGTAQFPEPTVYYAENGRAAADMQGLSLKHLLIEVNSIEAVADWRRHPGKHHLAGLVEKFNSWYSSSFRRRGDPHLGPIGPAG